ncbi:MAG: DUF1697 domain-containing protein [Actinobacteria bacterium]|jgi:uncharacterized protein (DUF1697 family)|nr:DUF1697 domain-containing protein [Actinomycetota bacterium]
MTTYIALLRGVNVGGHNKVPMGALRTDLEAAGFGHVRTYIQSGNVLVDTGRASPQKVADRVREVIADTLSLDIPTIALDAASLAGIVDANPYADEPDHKRVHAIFLPTAPDPASVERLRDLESAFSAKGSPDTITLDGSTLYLHTPDGFGTSELAKALTTKGRIAALNGTARNWATVTTLLAMARQ